MYPRGQTESGIGQVQADMDREEEAGWWEVANRFSDAEFSRRCGMKVESVTRGEVRVSLPIAGTRNVNGVVHGGAIFSLADEAFGIAANLHGHEVAVMAGMRYLAPATGDLTATARCVGQDRQKSCYRVEVRQENLLVAVFTGNGFKLDNH
jgi:acyl-CoA thioesterase